MNDTWAFYTLHVTKEQNNYCPQYHLLLGRVKESESKNAESHFEDTRSHYYVSLQQLDTALGVTVFVVPITGSDLLIIWISSSFK